MPILNKNNPLEIEKYNHFIQTSPYGKLSQDIRWEYVKKGWRGDYIYLEENNKIIAAMSVLSITAIDGRVFMYANRGPICNFHDVTLTKKLIDELNPVIEKQQPFLLRIDPEIKYNEDTIKQYRDLGFTFRERETDIHDFIQPRFNMVLNLKNKSEETLLNEFNAKTRYNIRLSNRKGLKTTYDNSQEYIDIFFELTKIMAKRQGITHRPKDYFERMMAVYQDNRIYITWKEEEPLSAAVAFPYGDKMWYLYGASSNRHRNLMPNHNMQWEMIKWALSLKKDYYDFGGVFNFTNEDGLYRFKNGFCHLTGATEWIGELDLVFDSTVYRKFIQK